MSAKVRMKDWVDDGENREQQRKNGSLVRTEPRISMSEAEQSPTIRERRPRGLERRAREGATQAAKRGTVHPGLGRAARKHHDGQDRKIDEEDEGGRAATWKWIRKEDDHQQPILI